MKALVFHKFRNICIKTILWTRNTNCFTIFVHRNFRRKTHSDCEYHKSHGRVFIESKKEVSGSLLLKYNEIVMIIVFHLKAALQWVSQLCF